MVAAQSLVRWLLPKEHHFFRFLEQQANAAYRGAQALGELANDRSVEEVQAKVQALEAEGDSIVAGLEDALQRTFVTPIDREDLQLLSSELDDVLDLTDAAARGCALYGVTHPTEPMEKLIGVLTRSTQVLDDALPRLRANDYVGLLAASRSLRTLEKEGDAIYRGEVWRLFHDDAIDAKQVLREKEVLEDLFRALRRCENVGHTLANLAVKHG